MLDNPSKFIMFIHKLFNFSRIYFTILSGIAYLIKKDKSYCSKEKMWLS